MKQLYLLLLMTVHTSLSMASDLFICGAGATFPAPLYVRWAERYYQLSNIQVNYQAIGSGGGIKQVQAGTIDFGATDKPLSPMELKQSGLVQFPVILGAVVPVFNLPGIRSGELKLSGPILAKIFLGQITRWRDPQILALNAGLQLPDLPIHVIHRSESSGTTYLFTSYLSKVSLDWKNKVGTHAAIMWPVGLGAKGNEGVAVYVSQKSGSIAYIENTFVEANHLQYASLKNKAGYFVLPNPDSVKAAAELVDWDRLEGGFCNQDGPLSWPITGASYVLIKQRVAFHAQDKHQQLLAFFKWAFEYGYIQAEQLHYVPLPSKARSGIYEIWKHGFSYDKKLVLYP